MQTTQIWDKHSAHSLSAAIHFTRQVMLPDTVRLNFTCIMHTHIYIYLHTYLPTYCIFYTCTSSRKHIFDQLGDSYSKMIPVHPNLPNSERLHSVISLSTFVAINRDAALQSCWREAQVCLSSARAPLWGQQLRAEGHKPLRPKIETWSHSNQLSMATILLLSCIYTRVCVCNDATPWAFWVIRPKFEKLVLPVTWLSALTSKPSHQYSLVIDCAESFSMGIFQNLQPKGHVTRIACPKSELLLVWIGVVWKG